MPSEVIQVIKTIAENPQKITSAKESNGVRFFVYNGYTFSIERTFSKENVYTFSTFEEGVGIEVASQFPGSGESKSKFSSADTSNVDAYIALFNALTPKLNGVDKIFKSILDDANDGI